MAENQSAVEIVEEAKVMNVSRPWEGAPGGSIFREERREEDQVEGGKRDRWSVASAKSDKKRKKQRRGWKLRRKREV